MDQSTTIDLLADPATHGGAPVQRITTHISEMFLAGSRAYKLKRSVRYPFVDFSTSALRRTACEAEVRINRRTAPELYLGVAPVVTAGGRLHLGAISAAPDSAIDWVVVMRRFGQEDQLDRLARRGGGLTDALARELADVVAAFHASAEPRADTDALAALRWVIADNAGEMATMDLPTAQVANVCVRATGWLERIDGHLEARRRAGYVRVCHGDLHLRNLCLTKDRPILFDAIEFDDRLAVIDVAYDLGFLLMDLEHRGLRSAANIVFNRYLDRTGDLGLIAALPLFMGLRAAVRAQVSALAGDGPEARRYLDLARSPLEPEPARLVAIGGLSGTGKSTLARALAPLLGRAPGALMCRSDVIRKQRAGVSDTDRLPESAYSRESSRAVYAALLARAEQALAASHGAVVDAVFARSEERAQIEDVARKAGVSFTGLWLDADPVTLAVRVSGRFGDASDADARVVAAQATYDPGEIRWHRIDAAKSPDDARAAARAILRLG